MRKDKDWVAGARLRFGDRLTPNPEIQEMSQESLIFAICHDLMDADVQILDLRRGITMATIFEVKAPSRRTAREEARLTIERTTAPYSGRLTLSKLSVVPKDEVFSMMLETRPNTWPEISRRLPEERRINNQEIFAEHPPEEEPEIMPDDQPLAEIIPLFSKINTARMSHPSYMAPRQPAQVVTLFSTLRRDRP